MKYLSCCGSALVLALFFTFASRSPAADCADFFNAFDGGHYDSQGYIYSDPYHNYSAGAFANLEFRNFFVFHLPTFGQTIARAELWLYTYDIETLDASETYELHEITTTISNLTLRTGAPRTAIFDDLGDGPVYGSYTVAANQYYTTVMIPLTPTAISNMVSGGDFAVGGRITTLSTINGTTQLLFSASSGPSATLAIYYDPPLPPHASIFPAYYDTVAGSNIVINSQSCGRGPISYQWQHEGTNIIGGTNAQLVLTNVTLSDTGDYQLTVTDPYGTSTIGPLKISVWPLFILRPPYSLIVAVEDPFALSVDVQSLYPVQYQWFRFPNVGLIGETNAFFVRSSAVTNDSGDYFVVVSNSAGSVTSSVAHVTVFEAAPVIQSFPPSQTAPVGATVRLNAIVSGGPTPKFQWFFNDAPIPGAIAPELPLINISTNEAGDYRLLASNRIGSVLSPPATLTVTRAGPLDRWQLRNPFPQPNDLHDVAYGNGLYVAVGENGALVTSTNGTNWVLQNSKTDQGLWGVTFGNGRFVAVGTNVAVISTNGTSWQAVYPGPHELRAVTFGNGKFVAVANYSQQILVSDDGVLWQARILPIYQYAALTDITYGNGLFVAVALSGVSVLTSSDATNWSVQSFKPNGYDVSLEGVAYANGQFLAVGPDGFVGSSPDGTNWVQRPTPATKRFYDVRFGNGVYVAVGAKGGIIRSTDSVNWTQVNSGTPDRLEGLVFANSLFVALGESGTTLRSSDGATWIEDSAGFRRDWDGITDANGLVMAVGKSGMVLTTTNGVALSLYNAGTARDLHGATYGAGKFVAVGDAGTVVVSSNAVNWQPGPSPTNNDLKAVAYGNGTFAAVGTYGALLTSTDAVNWQSRPSGTFYDINDICFGNGLFVAVGDTYDGNGHNGVVVTSTDSGATWHPRPFYSGKFLRGVTYANTVFLIAGNDGFVSVSTNGVNWDTRFAGFFSDGDNLRGVTYHDGLWIIVGNGGIILSSPDTVNWKRHYAPVIVNLHGVRYVNGTFVAIGNAGVFLQSGYIHSILSGVMRNDGFQLTLHPGAHETYRVQSSSDLITWQTLFNLTLPDDPTILTDPSALTNKATFYRTASP